MLRTGVTLAHQLALSLYAEGSVRISRRSSSSPLFPRSSHQLLTFASPCFQRLAHSLIFWITPIPRPARSLRTLPQKTGGTPPCGHTTLLPSRRACPPKPQRRRAIPFVSPTYENRPHISFVSHTYAKTGGTHPPKNVGAPTFAI